jgi:hypothetical protein
LGAIIGGIAGGVALLALIAFFIIFCRQRSKRNNMKSKIPETDNHVLPAKPSSGLSPVEESGFKVAYGVDENG